jgi:hypothetical protein
LEESLQRSEVIRWPEIEREINRGGDEEEWELNKKGGRRRGLPWAHQGWIERMWRDSRVISVLERSLGQDDLSPHFSLQASWKWNPFAQRIDLEVLGKHLAHPGPPYICLYGAKPSIGSSPADHRFERKMIWQFPHKKWDRDREAEREVKRDLELTPGGVEILKTFSFWISRFVKYSRSIIPRGDSALSAS